MPRHHDVVRKADPQVREDVTHLVRRVAFGAPPAMIDELAALGYQGAVEAVCSFEGPDPAADAVARPVFDTAQFREARRSSDPEARRDAQAQARGERRQLVSWWLRRMALAEHPVRDKLAFFWHDHFATSIEKVKIAQLMYGQIDTIQRLGSGRFDTLVHAIARDPAMLVWLDGRENRAGHPNENLGRELLELFTLGRGSGEQGPNYTETDVLEASRALTGWVIRPADAPGGATGWLEPRRHDNGSKTVLGRTGNLGLDEIVEVTTSHPACARFITSRMWSYFARPGTPDDPVVEELAEQFAKDLDISALFRRMVLHPAFLDDETRTALVRTPVDFLVGLVRTLGIELDDRAADVLSALGQLPCSPPSVGGWPANEAWISTASALTRLQVAETVAGAVKADIAGEDLTGEIRLNHLGYLLGVARWSDRTASALDNAPDARTALALAIVAPEYLVA